MIFRTTFPNTLWTSAHGRNKRTRKVLTEGRCPHSSQHSSRRKSCSHQQTARLSPTTAVNQRSTSDPCVALHQRDQDSELYTSVDSKKHILLSTLFFCLASAAFFKPLFVLPGGSILPSFLNKPTSSWTVFPSKRKPLGS